MNGSLGGFFDSGEEGFIEGSVFVSVFLSVFFGAFSCVGWEDAGDAERWRSCEDLLLALVGVWVDGFRGLVLEGESRLRAESESST